MGDIVLKADEQGWAFEIRAGVYVNGAATHGRGLIAAGDRIRIGGVELRVESPSAA
jgi:hypothetical protein